MGQHTRTEIEATFLRWRAAVDIRDIEAMLVMFTPDAEVGNTVYGLHTGANAIRKYLNNWPDLVPNENVWYAIDGDRVVDKWRETLPGTRADGSRYEYFGITESIYAGNGRWRHQYGLPDVVGLQRVYKEWHADGHHETHGDVYSLRSG
jgi:hypothetical protein